MLFAGGSDDLVGHFSSHIVYLKLKLMYFAGLDTFRDAARVLRN